MSFPQKRFGLVPVGWKDLGKIKDEITERNGRLIIGEAFHTLCNRKAHIGKENGELFVFCPRCLIKLRSRNNV